MYNRVVHMLTAGGEVEDSMDFEFCLRGKHVERKVVLVFAIVGLFI